MFYFKVQFVSVGNFTLRFSFSLLNAREVILTIHFLMNVMLRRNYYNAILIFLRFVTEVLQLHVLAIVISEVIHSFKVLQNDLCYTFVTQCLIYVDQCKTKETNNEKFII